MKLILLFVSVSLASGLLLVNIYNSLIDARSWGSDIPGSVAAARQYFKTVNPGNFYRLFSPLNQITGLLVLVFFWKSSAAIRLNLGIAFIIYVLVDVFTFAYFYPRNTIIFKTALLTDVDTLKKAWSQWNAMNWVRSLLLLTGLFFSFLSLYKISQNK